MAERDRCQATHTAPTIPDGEPLTVQCDLPSGHVAQHESIDGGIIWGKPLSSVGGREPEPREGGFWVSSNQLSPADIAFARTRCGGWDWFVNESGLGWAFVPRLRASTPEGSERSNGQTAQLNGRDYSPPSHDVEALREALGKHWQFDVRPYGNEWCIVLTYYGDAAHDEETALEMRDRFNRALSQHVGGEG